MRDEFNLTKKDMITVSDRVEFLMNQTWSYGERLIKKYYLDDLKSVMGMDPDTFGDIKDMYDLASQLKDTVLIMTKQMDQINLVNALIVRQNNELIEKMEFLSEEIDSLKSKAKKND